jgi:hypothetical protein
MEWKFQHPNERAILKLQSTIGNRSVQRMLNSHQAAAAGNGTIMRKVSLHDVIAHTYENVGTAFSIADSLKTAKDLMEGDSPNLAYIIRQGYWLGQKRLAFEKDRQNPVFNMLNIISKYRQLAKKKDIEGLKKEGFDWQKYSIDCFQAAKRMHAKGERLQTKAAHINRFANQIWKLAFVPVELGGKPMECLIASRQLWNVARALKRLSHAYTRFARDMKVASNQSWVYVEMFNKKADQLIDES